MRIFFKYILTWKQLTLKHDLFSRRKTPDRMGNTVDSLLTVTAAGADAVGESVTAAAVVASYP